MDDPFNAGSPGPEEVDLYGKFMSLFRKRFTAIVAHYRYS
jgi:hypothetical protein